MADLGKLRDPAGVAERIGLHDETGRALLALLIDGRDRQAEFVDVLRQPLGVGPVESDHDELNAGVAALLGVEPATPELGIELECGLVRDASPDQVLLRERPRGGRREALHVRELRHVVAQPKAVSARQRVAVLAGERARELDDVVGVLTWLGLSVDPKVLRKFDAHEWVESVAADLDLGRRGIAHDSTSMRPEPLLALPSLVRRCVAGARSGEAQ